MMQPHNPFYHPDEQQLLADDERNKLRKDATYVGVLSIALTLVMQFAFTILVLVLMQFGLFAPEQLSLPDLGLGNTGYMFLYIGVYVFALFVPAVVVSLLFKKRFFPLAPTRPVKFGVAFLGIIGAIGLCMFSNIINSILLTFFSEVGLDVPEAPQTMVNTPLSLALNLFTMAVLPALLEEMIYRGYILRTLSSYGSWFAIIVSSALFSLMHGNLRQIPFAFFVGLVLGYLYTATDNIWIPIAVHFTNNAVSVLMEYGSFYLTEERANWFYAAFIYGLVFVGIIALIVLLVLYKKDLSLPQTIHWLSTGKRTTALLSTPFFLISIILYLVLLLMGS